MFYSEVEMYGSEYILVMSSNKSASEWFLYSKVHNDDFIKSLEGDNNFTHKILEVGDLFLGPFTDYLVEAIKVPKVGKVYQWKNSRMLLEIITAMNSAKTYSYSKGEVVDRSNEVTNSGVIDRVNLRSSYNYYKETSMSGIFLELEFKSGSIEVVFNSIDGLKLPKIKDPSKNSKKTYTMFYEELREEDRKFVSKTINVRDVGFESLVDSMDLSWYIDEETGKVLKKYEDITTDEDFERRVAAPMVYKILDNLRKGLPPLLIGGDVETDGLDFYYYPGNEHRLNEICSVQLSWEFDEGYNIFLNMEYFDNCSRDYVMKRLSDLFRWDRGKFIYKVYYDEDGNKLDEPREVLLDRDWYLLGGHNIIFDSKVFRRHGFPLFFDEDTLQMAFSIAPTSFKVKKDLKALTTHFLGLSYPELSTLLGKGNEDKFRYLRDKRVANLYGCADVDMFRKVWYKLKELMGVKLYKSYKRIDSYLLNVLAESEYYGLRIDKELIKKRGEEIKKDLGILEDQIYSIAGKMQLLQFCASTNQTCTQEQLDRAYYKFKISGKEILEVFYDKLKYPVTVLTKKKERALNSYAIDKLLYHTTKNPILPLSKDVVGSDGKTVLVSKDKFNGYKYPLAYVLKQYKILLKEYNGYYKPFFKEDTGDRLFRPIKAANIETRRISCATQTVKKDIKKCIIAHEEDYNLFDWDLAQVEARIFVSLAGDQAMIEKMRDPDKDYHTENAALINNMPPHLVPKDVRSKAKAIGFGVPYGLSDFKLCERMYTEVTDENMILTRILLNIFDDKNHISMEELKSYRMKAHDLQDVNPELKRFWGIDKDAPVSMIHNKNGFFRYQDMTKVLGDNRKISSVERAFGNFPIQSFAADFYKLLLVRLHKRIRKEGLQDKIIFHMYIHDELLGSFHKSVDPKLIVKLIKEECMVKIKGHTNYYLGINFGDNWNQCKKDEAELPVKFVQRLCANYENWDNLDWCDDPAEYFKPMIYEFKIDRVMECLREYTDIDRNLVNLDEVLDKFENYTVRSYLGDLKNSYKPFVAFDEDGEPIIKKSKFEVDKDDESKSRICYVISARCENLDEVVFIYNGESYSYTDLVSTLDEKYNDFISKHSATDYNNELEDLDIEEEEELEDDHIDEDSLDDEDRFFTFSSDESWSDEFIFVEDFDNEHMIIEKRYESLVADVADSFKYVETFGKTKILKLYNEENLDKLIFLLNTKLGSKNADKSYRVKIEIGDPNKKSKSLLTSNISIKVLPIEYKLLEDSKLEECLAELNNIVS